jgi:hypothetical protein
MAVGILDVVIDFCDQFLHTAKRSPAKRSLRNAVEPDAYIPSNTKTSYLWDITLEQMDQVIPVICTNLPFRDRHAPLWSRSSCVI